MPTKYLEMSQLKDVGRDQDMLATDLSVGVYGVVSYSILILKKSASG